MRRVYNGRMTGRELRQLREGADLRQEDLAKLIGHTQAAVSRWEASDEVPRHAERVVRLVLAERERTPTPAGGAA